MLAQGLPWLLESSTGALSGGEYSQAIETLQVGSLPAEKLPHSSSSDIVQDREGRARCTLVVNRR